MAKDSAQLAKQFIDASLKARPGRGPNRPPSKAAYARAIRLARQAIEELSLVASRVRS